MRLSAQTSAGCYLLEEKPSNIPLAVTQLISFPCRLLGSIEFYFFFFSLLPLLTLPPFLKSVASKLAGRKELMR